MQKFVRQQGHPSESQFPASRNKFLPGVLRGIVHARPEPLGEIQVTPAVCDVVGDHPRDRSDVAIPGPVRLIRVTVVARSREDLFHRRWHGHCGLQCPRRLDRRVFSRRAIDLNHYDQRDESKYCASSECRHRAPVPALIFRSSNWPARIVSELLPFAPANYRKFNPWMLGLRLRSLRGFFSVVYLHLNIARVACRMVWLSSVLASDRTLGPWDAISEKLGKSACCCRGDRLCLDATGGGRTRFAGACAWTSS